MFSESRFCGAAGGVKMKKYLVNRVGFIAAVILFCGGAWADTAADAQVGKSKAPVFTMGEKVIFTLKTDFAGLWSHRAPPNAEVPEEIGDFEAAGRLSWTDSKGNHDIPVSVELRGNTSQSESQCPFPKMTLGFKKDPATDERVSRGTLFDGLASVGVGTHCGGKPGLSPRFRRVWGGASPHREALVYKAQELLLIPGYEAAPAFFSYIDSNTAKGPVEPQPSGFVVNRPMPAFFLENIKTFVKYADGQEIRAADARFQDTDKLYVFTSIVDAQSDARAAGSSIRAIMPKDVIRILLFQALIGNYDWHLRIFPDDIQDSSALWNMKVVETDGRWIIFPYDYDLSGWVKSNESSVELPNFDHAFYRPDDIAAVVAEFREKRADLERLADELAGEDERGAESIKTQIGNFYDALRQFD